jgi:hypothetical protein
MHIVAHNKEEREQWKHTSMLAYNIGKFGNSDPKKYPATIKKYMPELWSDLEEEDPDNDPLIQAARARRLKKQ